MLFAVWLKVSMTCGKTSDIESQLKQCTFLVAQIVLILVLSFHYLYRHHTKLAVPILLNLRRNLLLCQVCEVVQVMFPAIDMRSQETPKQRTSFVFITCIYVIS